MWRYIPLMAFVLFTTASVAKDLLKPAVASSRSPASRNSFERAQMNPQRPPATGPWFEGWYHRITDLDGKRSVAVIVASTLEADRTNRTMSTVPGYIAVLVSEGDASPTRSFEAFPTNTSILQSGVPVSRRSRPSESVDFMWMAREFGSVSDEEIDLHLPGLVSVKARIEGRVPWSGYKGDFGPQGLSALFRFLPLHWYVDSRASRVSYEVETFAGDGTSKRMHGEGFVHREKNWGAAFPAAWMWVQGQDPNDGAYIALAGGRLEAGAARLTTFMIGYRSKGVEATFRPSEPDTTFHFHIDPCANQFEIRAQNADHELRLRATADAATFGSVSIPTRNGYVRNGGRESFSARVEVEVYRNQWWSTFLANRLLERKVFQNAALEFGADYQRCPQPRDR